LYAFEMMLFFTKEKPKVFKIYLQGFENLAGNGV
jgi:hypothetical protein